MDILMVDDHSLILQGIGRIIDRIPEVSKVYTATSGKEALRLINSRGFDIYILDIELPDISGFDLIDIIRKRDTEARIIINTMHEQVWIVNKLIKYEVDAVILKTSESLVVEQAVKSVLNNQAYCCPRFAHISRMLKNRKRGEIHADIPTKRELDVLKTIAKGHSSAQIAQILGISENTVETYRKQLFLKFDAKNVVELIIKATAKGLICIDSQIL